MVLVYCISLLGVFALIPLVGSYNAFVLGFIGKNVLASATAAAMLGYLVFLATGFLSGWSISMFHPKSVWIPAFVSLLLSGALLMGATWMRYKYFGVSGLETILPLPAANGGTDADKLSMAMKREYELVEPPAPPYLKGKASVVPLSELQPSLRLLQNDFQMQGGPYVYCNLSPQIWNGLRKDVGTYPILWSTQSEPSGKRLIISVDLKTDMFSVELVDDETLDTLLRGLEKAVQKQTDDPGFKLR